MKGFISYLIDGIALGWITFVLFLIPGLALADVVPVSIRITSVECIDEDCDAAGIEAAGESFPDFYVKIFMSDGETRTNRAPDNLEKHQPTDWADQTHSIGLDLEGLGSATSLR